MCFHKIIRRKKRVHSNGQYRCCICNKYSNNKGFFINTDNNISKYFCNNLCYIDYINIKKQNLINF